MLNELPCPCLYCCTLQPCRCESDPCYITNATDMKLRSFTTKVMPAGALLCRARQLLLLSCAAAALADAAMRACLLCAQVHKVDTAVTYKAS